MVDNMNILTQGKTLGQPQWCIDMVPTHSGCVHLFLERKEVSWVWWCVPMNTQEGQVRVPEAEASLVCQQQWEMKPVDLLPLTRHCCLRSSREESFPEASMWV